MRTQVAKVLVTFLLITGFSSVVLKAQVKSVGSMRHGTDTQVTVVFFNPVDPVTGATPGNYTFSAGITVTGASMMTGLPAASAVGVAENPAPAGRAVDNQCVVLTVTGLAADATASVMIHDVKDTGGNTLPTTTVSFKDSGYTWAESGTPALPGKVIAVGTNGFDIFSAGSAQWASYDEVVIVYKPITGDFDFKARIEFQDFSSAWARAGVMARENLNVGENAATQTGNLTATPPKVPTASRYADIHGNPVQDFNRSAAWVPGNPILEPANYLWESHYRDGGTLQGAANGTDSTIDGSTTPNGPPPYPNAWVRIARTGDELHTYRGSDGQTWDEGAIRAADLWVDPADGTTPKPLNALMYVGPSYSPEIGNIYPTDGKNRMFLYQVRFSAITVPYLRLLDPNPSGVILLLEDAAPPGTQVNTSTVQLSFDGNPVTASATKSGTTTTVAYKAAAAFPANSSHSLSLTFSDNGTPPNNQKIDRTFTIGTYGTIPATYAVASATNPGFNVRPHQIDANRGPGDENSLANAEQQAADGYLDPANGQPYPNAADLSGATGGIVPYTSVINWNNNGTAYGQLLPTPADIGNWQDIKTAPYNIADTQFPGMPGSGANNHNSAADAQYDSFIEEVTAYVQLKQGTYRMGVNSDDGFKVSVARGAPDVFGQQLGVFSGGRGSTDSFFDFVVAADGIYPFRLLWWNGTGGANLEWFTVNLATGEKVLLNEAGNPNAVAAFRTAQGAAYVKSIVPANGFTGVETNSTIKIVLVDGATTVVDGSISLSVDGNQVSPTISNGATTTVSYNIANKFVTSHTGTLIWGESTTPQTMHTNNFSFSVRQQSPDDLPSYTAGSFWIEAEDFDATGTPVPAEVNTMPYDIGANGLGPYDGIGATLNVDYFNTDNLDNGGATIYRSVGDPAVAGRSVDIANSPGNNFGERRPGGFDMTANYTIGWGGNGEWYNYTRRIPTGLYTALVALSDGNADAPAGTPDRMGGKLDMVTAGVGTTTQTLKNLGTFNGPSSGAWGYDNLVPLYAPDGSQAAFKITSATTTTLRFTLREGDYDWLVLIPVTGVPPKVTAASPLANTATAAASAVPRDAKVRLTIEDFSTAVNSSTVKLSFDGVDVTSTATVNKTADTTTVTYTPSLLAGGSTHTCELRYADNGTPPLTQTNSATFTVSAAIGTPGQFLIEAEDFDHDGGQAVVGASTMPYLGGAYAGLGAKLGIDYADSDAADSFPYRPSLTNLVNGANANVNMDQQLDAGTLDVVRADAWTLTANYKIGWAGVGNWYNYTRTFPPNTYQVWAALSHDPTDGLRGSLSQVTAGVGTTNQTVVALGTFDAPTSGAWGTDNLVQMKDSGGNPAVISLSGVQTVRFNASSGDYNYLLFVPGVAPLRFNAPTISGNTITISWTGGTATLQQANGLTGNQNDWSDVAPQPAGNTFMVTPAATGWKFYRLKQ